MMASARPSGSIRKRVVAVAVDADKMGLRRSGPRGYIDDHAAVIGHGGEIAIRNEQVRCGRTGAGDAE